MAIVFLLIVKQALAAKNKQNRVGKKRYCELPRVIISEFQPISDPKAICESSDKI